MDNKDRDDNILWVIASLADDAKSRNYWCEKYYEEHDENEKLKNKIEDLEKQIEYLTVATNEKEGL